MKGRRLVERGDEGGDDRRGVMREAGRIGIDCAGHYFQLLYLLTCLTIQLGVFLSKTLRATKFPKLHPSTLYLVPPC